MLVALAASHLLVERWSRRTWKVLGGWATGLGLFSPYLVIALSGGLKWGETETAVLATELAEPVVALLTNNLGPLTLPLVLNLVYQMWHREILRFRVCL